MSTAAWNNFRENATLALVVLAVPALITMAMNLQYVVAKVESIDQRLERVEERQDRHLDSHNGNGHNHGD